MRKPSAILSLLQRYSALFTWAAIYLLFYLVSSAHQSSSVALIITNSAIAPMILVWAFIYYFLAPRTLHQHRITFYLSCAALLAVTSVSATELDILIFGDLYERGEMHYPPEVEAAIQRGESQRMFMHTKYVFLIITTMAVTTISWLLDERKRLNHLQREHRTRLELKYLRAQINPHFLFNALNCIYSLTLLQDEKAPDSVLKLSEMLRYVTDDCRSDLVPLQKEVTYIRNFIDFQLIRMEKPGDVTFDTSIQNPSFKIPPMLFQPMVENCFKHSRIIDTSEGFIHLSLLQSDRMLTFTAVNSKPANGPVREDGERIGIGLKNVFQRLELLFRDKGSYQINETDSQYSIQLCIKY